MTKTEQNPLHAAYWVGETSPEPLALFRIALGLSLLHDTLNFAPNIATFLSDEGILPREALLDRSGFSVFYWVGSPAATIAVFALGACALLAFTLGYRTRMAAALSFLFVVSIKNRNLYIDDGGDDLVRNLLFLSMFADLGGCYSLDVRSGRRARGSVAALGLRFLQLHIALLYFCAARLKFRAGWLKQNVIYRCLQLLGFVRPPGALLARFPALCYVLGLVTLSLEWAFAFLALSPVFVRVCRALAIAASLGVQLGILATMRVGIFTEVMLVVNFLFVPAEWIQAVETWLRRRLYSSQPRPPLPSVAQRVPTWGTTLSQQPALCAMAFVLSLNFVLMAWGPFVGRRFPLPASIGIPRRMLTLDQPFGLFDRIYPGPTWAAVGTLPGGQRLDVLSATVPELVPHVAWSFSRWYKFTFVVQDHPFPYEHLANYLCKLYRERTKHTLASIAVTQTLTLPHYPNQPPAPAETRLLIQQRCVDAP